MTKNKFLISFLAVLYLAGLGYFVTLSLQGTASPLSSFVFYLTLSLVLLAGFHLPGRRFLSVEQYRNGVLMVCSIMVCLFCTELVLRYFFKTYLNYTEKNGGSYYHSMYQPKSVQKGNRYNFKDGLYFHVSYPNSTEVLKKPEFEYMHCFNEFGFRDRSFQAVSKDSAEILIMGLGDSFTEGVGAPQDSTWLKIMEGKINQPGSSQKVVTFNAGKGGSDPIWEYIKCREFTPLFLPQIVILGLNESDIANVMVQGGTERNHTLSPNKGPWWEIIYANSLIARNIIHNVLEYNYLLLKKDEWEVEKKLAKKEILKIVRQFETLSHEQNFKLVVVFSPTHWEMISGKHELENVYEQLKNTDNITCFNLFQAFRETGEVLPENAHTFYWELDGHFNSKGYQLWGELLADYLLSSGLLN